MHLIQSNNFFNYLRLADAVPITQSLTLLANRRELRVSPKLSTSGAMLTNIRLEISEETKQRPTLVFL